LAITFDRSDHLSSVPQPGRRPLVVELIIGMKRLTKVLMDGGSSLNIMYAKTLDAMGSIGRAFGHSVRRSTASCWESRQYHLGRSTCP
jgi:hypothetical protein